MKKILIFCLGYFLFSKAELRAQVVYLQDISGSVIQERSLVDLGGSPYFNDEFLKGSIKVNDKTVYDGLYLRYDLESDQLTYRKANSNVSMSPSEKVTEFSIQQPSGAVAVFKRISKEDPNIDGFYQVLFDGKVSLLKKVKRRIVEKVEYNSSSKTKSLVTQTNYYAYNPSTGSFNALKGDKRTLAAVFGDKAEKVSDFIKKEDVSFKNEASLINLMTYYNSIN
jgi:hypothetical protein